MKKEKWMSVVLLLLALCLPLAALAEGELFLPRGLREIRSGAFENIGEVRLISIPADVESIAEDAFADCGEDVVIRCSPGSYAQTWAEAHGFTVECGEGYFLFTVEDGEVMITGYTDADVTEVVIPEMLGGYPVTGIETEAFYHCKQLKRVTIPPCVTYIGWYVFYQEKVYQVTICGELNSMAHEVAEIEGYNFEPLDGSLKSGRYYYQVVDGEVTITSFDETNMRITSVTVPETLGGYPVRRIGEKAFSDTQLKKVTLSEGLLEISVSAFEGGFVEQITLPDSVERIEDCAFYNCWSLTTINMPRNLVSVGEKAFSMTEISGEITIPASTQTIGADAFLWAGNLITVYLETDTVQIGETAFDAWDTGNPVLALVAGSGSTAQAYAQENETLFYERGTQIPVRGKSEDGFLYLLRSGEAVIMGYDYEGDYLFPEQVSLPASAGGCPVTMLGEHVVSGNRYLVTFEANAALREIAESAFNGCVSLKNLNLNEGLERIGEQAFVYCDALETVTIPSTVTQIEGGAFGFCSSLTSIALPAGITEIAMNTFFGCWGLTQIELPAGVEKIGDGAFGKCISLKEIELPAGVTEIGDEAFAYCSALEQIVIPPSVTTIGEDVFVYSSNVQIVGEPGSAAEAYAASNGLVFDAM